MMENQLSIALSKNKLLKNVDILKINLSEVKGKLISVGEGEILYREGDPSNNIFLVISGEINVIKKRLLGKTKSYIFVEDDFFGHEEYFEETARTSTAVALRDSYLISLSDIEIENLVQQDQQIFSNLHEPVEETADDFTPYEEGENSNKSDDVNLSENTEPVTEKEIEKEESGVNEKNEAGEEFFKSIADFSMTSEMEIVPAIEKSHEEPDMTEPENIPESDVSDKIVENEKIEQGENITSENDSPPIETDKIDESETASALQGENEEKSNFDESMYLNEDGIPKAEFEIPDHEETESAPRRPTRELDDVLFQILNSELESTVNEENNEEKVIEQNEEQESIDQSGDETKEDSSDSVNPIDSDDGNINVEKETEELTPVDSEIENKIEEESNTLEEVQGYDNDSEYSQEQMSETVEQPAEYDDSTIPDDERLDDNDDIIAEVDEKLRKIENGELVENSDKWRTMSTEGEEMDNEQLQMIIKAAELVNSTIKIDEVLIHVVDVAKGLTNSDRGTLYLIDREKNELWSMVTTGEGMKEIRLKIGEGLAGYVALSGEVINIKDVQQDPRFKGDIDKATGYKTENMICFPIKNNKSEIIGVLQLLNSANGEFSSLDENFLNAISIHSAIALQNAAMVEQLLQSERVQSLGKMANFLIQDIKKPILVSKRYSEHLKSKDLSQDVVQVLDMLLEQLTQVADLVQTTSSYANGKTMLRTLNVSINNTLSDYASRIDTFLETRNCKIESNYDKDVTVKLEVKEFYQCYLHIIKNACDAMPEGGIIKINTKREDKYIKLIFSDNGLGIPDEFRVKIFEPFMSYGKKNGTGLGLSITKKIIESHNGTIEVQSSLGEGATFVITLPIITAF